MSTKHKLEIKKIPFFFGAGRFYWRLIILPFIGALVAFLSFLFSVDGFTDDPLLPLSFMSIFATAFLFVLAWTTSETRDKLLANRSMDLFIQWPMDKRLKKVCLYFCSAWLPGLLLLVGATIGIFVFNRENFFAILAFLPYIAAVSFIVSILIWKGSFTTIDVGTFPGKVSYREETWYSLRVFLLCLSPMLISLIATPLMIVISIFITWIGAVYMYSPKSELQTMGFYQGPIKTPKDKKKTNLVKLNTKKSPFFRYFLLLDWDGIKMFYIRPFSIIGVFASFLLYFISGLFIVVIYYSLGGLFNPSNVILVNQRAAYISLLSTFSIFMIHWNTIAANDISSTALLLPVSLKAKSMATFFNRILRPSVYTFLSTIGTSILILLLHRGLALFIEQDIPPFGELLTYAFLYLAIFIPFCVAALSLLEFLYKSLIIMFQKFRFHKGSVWLNSCSFFIYLFPFILMMTLLGKNIARIDVLWTSQAIIIYGAILILSKLGLHWTMKKVQVISK